MTLSKIDSRLRVSYISVDMRQRLPLVLLMAAFAASAVLLASSPSAVYAQAIEVSSSDCYASLSKAKLVVADAGSKRARKQKTDPNDDCQSMCFSLRWSVVGGDRCASIQKKNAKHGYRTDRERSQT